MHPLLIQLGPIPLHTYGVLISSAILLALWMARQRAAKAGLDPDRVWNLGIYLVLAGLFGAKVWYVAADWEFYGAHPAEIFSLATFQAAGVWYGGVLGGLIVGVLYVRHFKLPFFPLADVCFLPASLAHGIGRLGCFTAGCCWGKATTVVWGVTFTNPYAHERVGVPLGVAMHPTQLYEAVGEFLTFGILVWLSRRQRFSGQIFAAYAMLYGVVRFTNEFFRGDTGRTMLFGTDYSLMQAVSLAMIATGALVWWLRAPKKK